jgi:hypothetical protein
MIRKSLRIEISSLLGRLFLRQPAGSLQRVPQEILYLRVERTQVIISPPLDSVKKRAIDAKKKRFSLGH